MELDGLTGIADIFPTTEKIPWICFRELTNRIIEGMTYFLSYRCTLSA